MNKYQKAWKELLDFLDFECDIDLKGDFRSNCDWCDIIEEGLERMKIYRIYDEIGEPFPDIFYSYEEARRYAEELKGIMETWIKEEEMK